MCDFEPCGDPSCPYVRPPLVRFHGDTAGVDVAVWLGDDPDLANVDADMRAWSDAHPCECEALCTCDRDEAGS